MGEWLQAPFCETRGLGGRRDASPTLRKRPGHPAPALGGYAAAKEDSGWRIEDGKTGFLRADKTARQEGGRVGSHDRAAFLLMR